MSTGADTLFPGFARRTVDVGGVPIHARIGGEGPPVLLLHGYPQTHVCWHRVAPALARHFTVVCADLRGYGDSGRPASDGNHSAYAKRRMAGDCLGLMAALGFARFAVAGHDRGGRVAERLARDHRDAVTRLAVLDIIPVTLSPDLLARVDADFARDVYHFFFLSQPADLPERLIGAEPAFFLRWTLERWGGAPGWLSEAAFAEYLRCFSDPASIHATCEDYRAGLTADAADNASDDGPPLACPLLSLWGRDSKFGARFDPLAYWRERARDVRGEVVAGGHFVPEESPEAVIRALSDFLGG